MGAPPLTKSIVWENSGKLSHTIVVSPVVRELYFQTCVAVCSCTVNGGRVCLH